MVYDICFITNKRYGSYGKSKRYSDRETDRIYQNKWEILYQPYGRRCTVVKIKLVPYLLTKNEKIFLWNEYF